MEENYTYLFVIPEPIPIVTFKFAVQKITAVNYKLINIVIVCTCHFN